MTAELTPRQFQVWQFIATGMTDKEIAVEMSVSLHTVKAQLKALQRKLALRNRTEIAVAAYAANVKPLPEPVAFTVRADA